MNKVELFNNLAVMAMVDGKISDEEATSLAQRAVRWGISEEEAQQAIQNAMASEREFTIPPTKQQRLDVLKEMIEVMATDGKLAGPEESLCASAAVAMEISPKELKDLLASMTQ